MDEESDEDFEIQKLAASYEKKGAKVHGLFSNSEEKPKEPKNKKGKRILSMEDTLEDGSSEDEVEVVPDAAPSKCSHYCTGVTSAFSDN